MKSYTFLIKVIGEVAALFPVLYMPVNEVTMEWEKSLPYRHDEKRYRYAWGASYFMKRVAAI